MQAQLVRDVAQNQRAHGHFTVFKERLLPVNDSFRHFQDSVKSLLDVLHQPFCLLQPRGHFAVAAAVFRQQARVHLVDAQTRHGAAVERRHPASLAFLTETSGITYWVSLAPKPAVGRGLRRAISAWAAQRGVVHAQQFFSRV